jgi:hypothetical protein
MTCVLLVLLAAAPAGASAAGPGDATILTVTTRDYSFDAPSSVPAGLVTVHLVNRGREPHQAWLMRLPDGKSIADFLSAMRAGEPPRWAVDVGGPNAVAPGGEEHATLVLTPGRYAFLCFVPSSDGVPHLMKGMTRELTVTGPDPHATLPPADITLRLVDYAFAFSKPLTSGRHVIRVRNEAQQPHEVTLWRLVPGATPEKIAAWAGHPDGPPPAISFGGVTGLSYGQEVNWPVDLEPGEYALLCFLPDAADGKMHTAHGMLERITVR